jgi:peptide/nickel transport system permease protein
MMARRVPVWALAILAGAVLLAIGVELSPYSPVEGDLQGALTPPFWQQGGSLAHPLGTDQLGRDILTRIAHGARISLAIAVVAVLVSGLTGWALAIVAGYLGGWADRIVMRATDIMLSLPFYIVALAIAAVVGPGIRNIVVILSVMLWAGYARVLRSEVLRLKSAAFVSLAVVAGASRARIMLRHIAPNTANTFLVLATLQLGMTVIFEASLSFMGVGVPPPSPAWGLMLAEGRQYITRAWWLCVFPGVAISLVVLSCNFLGDWLRDRLDPTLRQL